MSSILHLSSVLLVLVTGSTFTNVVLAADYSQPFHMSSEINATTINSMGGKQSSTEAKALTEATEVPAKQGKVIENLQANDFSYLLVENNTIKVWIAGIKVEAKAGDTVKYVENVKMDNFLSKALNRTFAQVIFASSIEVVK